MEPSTSSTLISDHIIKALCNTLMHSLWQGVLLAAAAGLIIIFTRKANPVSRYNLLIGALVSFAAGILFTFMWELQPPQNNLIAHTGTTVIATPVTIQVLAPVTQQDTKESLTEAAVNYLNTHYNTIVLIWFLIICAKSIQMAVGLHGIFHLKRTKVFAVGNYWENKLIQLSEQLRIKQTISLMESGLAKAPMVIGHLKPVILIPVGLINALTADEVEAILIHELAHIGRRDYLVNLMQSFMEIVFFFNPAVLWISQLIKTERENCCDDIAVSQTSSKINYINALVSCQEYQLSAPAYSVALSGNKRKLVDRVKRMISNRNQSLNIMEKTLLTICLVCAGLFTVAFSEKEPVKTFSSQKTIINSQGAKKDTARDMQGKVYRSKDLGDGTTLKMMESRNGKPQFSYVFKRKGVLYQINMDHNKVSSLLINERKIPAGEIAGYQPKIDELLNEYKLAEEQNGDASPDDVQSLLHRMNETHTVTGGDQVDEQTAANLLSKLSSANKQNSILSLTETSGANNQALTDLLAKASAGGDLSASTSTAQANLLLDKIRQNELNGSGLAYGANKDSVGLIALQQLNATKTLQSNGLLSALTSASAESFTSNSLQSLLNKKKDVNNEVVDELVKAGIIKNKDSYSFTITNDELIVDGLKQPEELHQKILAKYVKKPGDVVHLTYSFHH